MKSSVTVVTSSFENSLRKYRSNALPVLLELAEPLHEVISLLRTQKDKVLPRPNEGVGLPELTVTSRGVCLVVTHRSEQGLLGWLDRVAEWLTTSGRSGVIRIAEQQQPNVPPATSPVPCVVGGLVLTEALVHDSCPAGLSEAGRSLVDWCVEAGGEVFLEHRWLSSSSTHAEIRHLLAIALTLSEPAGLVVVGEGGAFRRIAIDARGHVVAECSSTLGVLSDAKLLEALLRELADRIAYGFVRHGLTPSLTWADGVSRGFSYPPAARGNYFEFFDDEERRHVPDAYPMQWVTQEHLNSARDLGKWQFEPVGNGFMMKSRSAEEWLLSPPGKNDFTVASREDLGEMIIDQPLIRRAVARFQQGDGHSGGNFS